MKVKAFRRTTPRQRVGTGCPPRNATLMVSTISDSATKMEKAWTEI